MNSREQFEAWSAKHEFLGGCYLTAQPDGRYLDIDLQAAWEAWQASRDAVVVELPGVDTWSCRSEAMHVYKRECKEAIEAAGVKVAP